MDQANDPMMEIVKSHDKLTEPVTIKQFLDFVHEEMTYRRENQRRLAALENGQNQLLVAMFAESAENEFKQPGVMTTMRKIDSHIDSVCWWTKLIRKIVVGCLGFIILLGSTLTALKVLL